MKNVTGKNTGAFGIHITVVCIVVFLITGTTIFGRWVFSFLNYNNIYEGIAIAGYNVSGMSPEQAKSLLTDRLQDPVSGVSIRLESEIGSRTFFLSEIEYSYGIDIAVNKAYSIGHNGNIFRRVLEIINAKTSNVYIDVDYSYNQQKLEDIIGQFFAETFIKMKESDITISEDTITIYSGHAGMQIDKDKALRLIQNVLENPQETTLDIPVTVIVPSKIDVDKVYHEIYREPQDAFFRIENSQVIVEPHVNGRSADRDVLADFIETAVSNEDSVRSLTLVVTEPSLTKEEAERRLFTDILAESSSKFYTGNENDRNRAENIRLASNKINSTLLAPGDVFSFNEVVGPRTAAAGYKVAHVYTAGEVVDDIGGGICQVSSTLYIASLCAGLETVERLNHIFTVAYVPLGQDATVSYGTVDFKFRNSTRWPVRIEAEITDKNEVIFRIVGTNDNPGRTIELVSEVKSMTPYNTVYIDDPDLFTGVEVVKQEGKEGYTVDTYKIVKNGDEIISNTLIHRSTYKPLTKQIRRGTKTPPEPNTDTGPEEGNDRDNEPGDSTPGDGVSGDSVSGDDISGDDIP
jgi:vancomycin resistance protein YoaR